MISIEKATPYPRGHFQLAFVAAESADALANKTSEPIETSSAILARVQHTVIDFGFTSFSLVTEHKSQLRHEFPRKKKKKNFQNGGLPVAGAGEIVNSVDASASVETEGRMETIVRIVRAPRSAESRRTDAENLSVRLLMTRSSVETRRLVNAPGRFNGIFTERTGKM
jgi:hypothetical protein